jgi:PAS domain S-box-containing protein
MNKTGFDTYCTDLLDKTNDLIFFLSPDRKLEWVNACWLKTLKYKPEEIEETDFEKYIASEDEASVVSALKKIIRNNESFELEFSFLSKTGKTVFVTGKLEMATSDEARYIRGIFKDVTKYKTIEKELQQSAKHTEIFFQNSPEAIVVVYQQLNIVAWNNKAVEIFGYNAAEIINKSSIVLIPERYREQYKFAVTFFLKTGYSPLLYHALERKVLNKNHEEFFIRVSISKIHLNDQWFFMGFVTDITNTKKMEEQLLRREMELMQSKLLDDKKDEFISIASHELKTPVTTIKAFAQIALKQAEKNSDAAIHEYLKKINIHTNKLDSLLTELLDVSKIHAGKLILSETVVDFGSYLNEVMQSIKYVTPTHNINVNVKENALVEIDTLRIEQVITNLVNNAAKYSSGKKIIDIETYIENGYIITAIKDYGIGISEKNMKKLFDRFYRVEETSKSYAGLGIGLFISNEIIKHHKGKIWVESKEGEGSVFYFSLPVYKK